MMIVYKALWLAQLALYAHSFYVYDDEDRLHVDEEIRGVQVEALEWREPSNLFPERFRIRLREADDARLEFAAIEDVGPEKTSDRAVRTWTTGPDGAIYEIEPKPRFDQRSKAYRLIGSNDSYGVVTLIPNDLADSTGSHEKFRLIGSVFFDDHVIEILPVVVNRDAKSRKKRETADYDAGSNMHSIRSKVLKTTAGATGNLLPDELTASLKSKLESSRRSRRSIYEEPVQFYVELLAVTDISTLEMHAALHGTNDTEFLHGVMSMYYIHLMQSVSERFKYSLRDDPEFSVQIILTNILFIEDQSVSVWTDPYVCGLNGTRNIGRYILYKNCTINRFKNYMNQVRTSLKFSYDHAIALFNKDLFEDGLLLEDVAEEEGENYEGILAVSYIYGICSYSYEYSIAQDYGGFTNSFYIAHEIGHNLGAGDHDGEGEAESCSADDNFIMTPSFNQSSGLLNLFEFSNCSKQAMKHFLFDSNFGFCLRNRPNPMTKYAELVDGRNPGEFLDPNDQCKMLFGKDAFFNQNTASMCSQMYCYPNVNSTWVFTTGPPGVGAAEGTLCGSGKICSRYECVADARAPTGECLFGDLFTRAYEGGHGLSCEEGVTLMVRSNFSMADICSSENYKWACCSTCGKYMKIKDHAHCFDIVTDCDYDSCNDTTLYYDRGLIGIYKEFCRLTCGSCQRNVSICETYQKLCENGGTCVEEADELGYRCLCAEGFHGATCEYRKKSYGDLYKRASNLTAADSARFRPIQTAVYGLSPLPDEISVLELEEAANRTVSATQSAELDHEFLLTNVEIGHDCFIDALEFYAESDRSNASSRVVDAEDWLYFEFWKFTECQGGSSSSSGGNVGGASCADFLGRQSSFASLDYIRFVNRETEKQEVVYVPVKAGLNYYRFLNPVFAKRGSVVYLNTQHAAHHRLGVDKTGNRSNHSDLILRFPSETLHPLKEAANWRFYLRLHAHYPEFFYFGAELVTTPSRLKRTFTGETRLLLLSAEVTRESTLIGFEVFCQSIGVVELSLWKLANCGRNSSCAESLAAVKYKVNMDDVYQIKLGKHILAQGFNFFNFQRQIKAARGSLLHVVLYGSGLTFYRATDGSGPDLIARSSYSSFSALKLDRQAADWRVNLRLVGY